MQTNEHKPLSIIEALAGGFELIRQNPWILILPILLDLFIWQGPQIGAQPVFDQLVTALNVNAVFPPDTSSETLQNFAQFKTALQNMGTAFNANGIIATGLPTLFWIIPPIAGTPRSLWISVDNGLALVGMLMPLTVVGALVTALYFELIGRAVRKQTDAQSQYFGSRTFKGFATILVLLLILVLGTVGFMIPVSLGATALSFVSQGLASFALLVASLAIVWTMLYLAFTLPAIFVSGANALQAIFDSVSLFRFDLWSSMGLIILTYLIRMGFTIVWQLFGDNPWGLLFDVIANAFLGSGLTAATVVFYADRIDWLNRLRDHIRQHAPLKG